MGQLRICHSVSVRWMQAEHLQCQHWSSEESKTEEAYSFIIYGGINDSRLDLAS